MSQRGLWLVPAVTAAFLGTPAFAGTGPSVAFFYGKPVPVAELARFEWVVVEPDHLGARGLEELQRAGVQVFAYLSLGEAAPDAVDPGSVLGRNTHWGSVIVDPRADGWRARMRERVDALHARGFRGLFLDTLDSYAIVLRGEARRTAATAMAALIRDLGDRHRDMKLFFNRGFELLDEVGHRASAVAAESLVFGWDAGARRYVEVPAPDRAWLTDKLREVAQRFGIPIVIVDYLPASRRDDARAAAGRIQALGFIPWIATPALDTIGVGAVHAPAARMLLLHDGREAQSPVLDLIAERLQALGCDVDHVDVRRGLPREPSGHRAGIVTWFSDDDLPEAIGYPRWLAQQIDAGSRVAMFGRPGFRAGKPLLARLGLRAAPASGARAARVVRRDELIGADAEPVLRSRGLVRWHAVAPDVDVHLRIEDAVGHPIDPVVTAPWGGLALQPYLLEMGYQGRARWIVDPTAFLQRALGIGRGGTRDACAPVAGGGQD
jgi:polysaccharide biosynthesis protein PelA